MLQNCPNRFEKDVMCHDLRTYLASLSFSIQTVPHEYPGGQEVPRRTPVANSSSSCRCGCEALTIRDSNAHKP